MLKIRLRRTGKRNQPHYRLVVAEHTAPVTGKIVDHLGHFNPRTKELVVNKDEALRWMNQGAQPSNTVARLLLKHGLAHKALVVHTFAQRAPKKAVPEAAVPASTEASADKAAEESIEVTDAAAETAEETEVATSPAEETPTESTESATEPETTKEEVAEAPQESPSEQTEETDEEAK